MITDQRPLAAGATSTSATSARADAAIAHLRGARVEDGFTGGDATYSVPLAGGRTAWIFGDSFIGGVQPDGSRSSEPTTFVRNSIVLQDDPTTFRTVTGRADGAPVDAVLPPGMRVNRDGTGPHEWYWPGHGTTRGDDLLVFMNRFDTPPGDNGMGWTWRHHGTDLARLDAATGALREITRVVDDGRVHWGSAVLERGPHTYVYGAEDDPAARTKHVHVARVAREELDRPESWRYWDGADWASDAARSARIASGASMQFGVVDAVDGSTLLVTQDGFDPAIRVMRATEPHGPYSTPVEVARIPDQPNGRHVYNAVPHPQFTDDQGLLVSYNVGGADFMLDHESYRPGFVRVPHEALPGGGVQVPRSGGVTSPEPARAGGRLT